jgi:hypothetical protein
MRPRTRRSASTIRGGTPEMTSGRADANQAGARPYQRWSKAKSLLATGVNSSHSSAVGPAPPRSLCERRGNLLQGRAVPR